MSLEA